MDSEPAPPTAPSRRPSGSAARRGSASAASRARSGAARVDPPRPAAVRETEDDEVVETVSEGADEGTADIAKGAAVAAAAAVSASTAKKSAAPRKPASTTKATAARKPAARTSTTRKPAAKKPTAPPDESVVDTAAEDAEDTAPEVSADVEVVEVAPEPPVEDAVEVAAPEKAESTESTEDAEDEPAPEPEPAPEATVLASAPAATAAAKKTIRIKRRPVRPTAPASPADAPAAVELALSVEGLTKSFGSATAVDAIDLAVTPGSFFGIVGPNGAGKTTTLSMITGLLRPDEGTVRVFGRDVWANPTLAKRQIGVLPDRLRLFDRLTGAEFLYHAGALRGLDRATITRRSADLASAFGLEHSLHRLVSDYSAGMTKKIAIAAAMIHAPRLLVLDEPFESVDPVSTALVIGVLQRFTAAGGTVVLSSHSMELTERVCDAIAVIVDGRVLAGGPIAEVLAGRSLEERFVELAGGASAVEGMEWLQNFSD